MSRTSEFVSLGHPDKITDYISEYIFNMVCSTDKGSETIVIEHNNKEEISC